MSYRIIIAEYTSRSLHLLKEDLVRQANKQFRPNALGPKKGQRSIAPKKASLVKQRKITKVRHIDPPLFFLVLFKDTCRGESQSDRI